MYNATYCCVLLFNVCLESDESQYRCAILIVPVVIAVQVLHWHKLNSS